MSSFLASLLDSIQLEADSPNMPAKTTTSRNAAREVRNRVTRGGERFWKHSDFSGLPASAVSQALSRLARGGELQRMHKGLYYRSRPTVLGPSRPSPSAVAEEGSSARLDAAGLTAANLLGFSSQSPARPEYASSAQAASRALRNALVHTRRPANRTRLTETEGALLEFLRDRGATSDLDQPRTCQRLLDLLKDESSYTRLAKAAQAEPPRVRAMLGAAGEQLGMPERWVEELRRSLNPLSRFEFGALACLSAAKRWQAQ
jgi:hypothetical protein